jgi:hypothetical protein
MAAIPAGAWPPPTRWRRSQTRPERPSLDLLATLGRGDGFTRVLERAGVAGAEAAQVAGMVSEIVPIGEIAPGTTMDVTLGRRANRNVARPARRLSFRARFDLKLSLKRVDGKLTLARIPISVDNTPLRIQGESDPAFTARPVPRALLPSRSRHSSVPLQARSMSEASAPTTASISSSSIAAPRPARRNGQLLYAGLDRSSGKDLQLMQWEQGGKTQWFEASGVGKASGMLQRPVPGWSRRISVSGATRSSATIACTRAWISAQATARRSLQRPKAAFRQRAGPADMESRCVSTTRAA